MPWASSSRAASTTSWTERLCPRWITSQPWLMKIRRMMLIEASWPSKRAEAVTRRIGCWGWWSSTMEDPRRRLVGCPTNPMVGHPTNYWEVATVVTWSPAASRTSPSSSVRRTTSAVGRPGCSKTSRVEPERRPLDDVATRLRSGTARTTRRSSSRRRRSTYPCFTRRSTALVTLVGCTWSSEPSRVIGIEPDWHERQEAQHLVAREGEVERAQHGTRCAPSAAAGRARRRSPSPCRRRPRPTRGGPTGCAPRGSGPGPVSWRQATGDS